MARGERQVMNKGFLGGWYERGLWGGLCLLTAGLVATNGTMAYQILREITADMKPLPATMLSNAFGRQAAAKSLLEKEGYQVNGLRSAEPLDNFGYFAKRYRDCFTVQKTENTGHLYAKCVDTNLVDET